MMITTHQSQSIIVYSADEPIHTAGLQLPVVRVGASSCFASPNACNRCVFKSKRSCVSHIYSYLNSVFIDQYPEVFL